MVLTGTKAELANVRGKTIGNVAAFTASTVDTLIPIRA
jgi:hypothetical protein